MRILYVKSVNTVRWLTMKYDLRSIVTFTALDMWMSEDYLNHAWLIEFCGKRMSEGCLQLGLDEIPVLYHNLVKRVVGPVSINE